MNQFLNKYEHTVFPATIIVAAVASWLVMAFGGTA